MWKRRRCNNTLLPLMLAGAFKALSRYCGYDVEDLLDYGYKYLMLQIMINHGQLKLQRASVLLLYYTDAG